MKTATEIFEVREIGARKRKYTKCICECTQEFWVRSDGLHRANSCGCISGQLRGEKRKTHGMSKTRIYNIWHGIKERVLNENDTSYKNYGGRGISICQKWEKFEGFYEDMEEGYKDHLEIDRIDNDGNYTNENCRWATRKQQTNNSRHNHLLTLNGRTQNIREWAEELGIKANTLVYRSKRYGWSDERTLTEPVHTDCHKK